MNRLPCILQIMSNLFHRFHLPFLCLSMLVSGAQECCAENWSIEGKSWPGADRLFRRDSRWRGADAANSIDLGDHRVLWTFGDSFVDINQDRSQRHRKVATFIRNSIAIQTGYDPTCAEFRPCWQEKQDGTPTSFFRLQGEDNYWPGGGLMLDQKLLLFLIRVRNSNVGLGFSVVGWGAVLIANPQDIPRNWNLKYLSVPQNTLGVMVGSGSSVRIGEWIYSYGSDNSTRHKLFLTRIPVADVSVGDFSSLEWWNGSDTSWRKQTQINTRPPKPIVDDGQTEFTVHYQPKLKSFLLTQFESFPRSPIVIRYARNITGPWSPMQTAFIPEEVDITGKDTMIYAAKAHPEQATEGLAVTYCTNTFDLATVRTDESVYYPRFARFIFKAQVAKAAK
ncbi:MAG: DUF5005 domain-containing protein [Pirellulales bacterium]